MYTTHSAASPQIKETGYPLDSYWRCQQPRGVGSLPTADSHAGLSRLGGALRARLRSLELGPAVPGSEAGREQREKPGKGFALDIPDGIWESGVRSQESEFR
jgi:hypothetical protein